MEIDLFVKCPNFSCKEECYWSCSRCSTKCVLKDTGYISCSTSNCLNRFIQYVKFLCNNYSHSNEDNVYKTASDFLMALASATKSIEVSDKYSQKELMKFSTTICMNINNEWKS